MKTATVKSRAGDVQNCKYIHCEPCNFFVSFHIKYPVLDYRSVESKPDCKISILINASTGSTAICPFRDIISVEKRIKPFISVPSGTKYSTSLTYSDNISSLWDDEWRRTCLFYRYLAPTEQKKSAKHEKIIIIVKIQPVFFYIKKHDLLCT